MVYHACLPRPLPLMAKDKKKDKKKSKKKDEQQDSGGAAGASKAKKRFLNLIGKQEEKRGFLVAFDGPDGSGKTTQRKLFASWLESEGYEVAAAKWSSSPLVKPLIKARKKAHSLSPEEFALLQAADFRYNMDTQILPALWDGKMVVADQYLFTSLARDAARGLKLNWLLNLYAPLLWPDMVFYFAVSPETSGKRIAGKKKGPKYYDAGQDITNIEDPLESYKQFVSRIVQEYEALSVIFQFVKVDAEKTIYEQHRQIRQAYEKRERRPWAEWNSEVLADWLERREHIAEVQESARG